MTKVASFLVLL